MSVCGDPPSHQAVAIKSEFALIKERDAAPVPVEGPWTDAHVDRRYLVALVDEMTAALKVAHQFSLEVAHAQDTGPSWYTRGANGLYHQIEMWRRKAMTATYRLLQKVGYEW